MKTLGLALLGVLVGLIAWAMVGLGCRELGLVTRFDPIGVAEDPPPGTLGIHVLEWSFPAFALVGAIVVPRFVRWAVQPGGH